MKLFLIRKDSNYDFTPIASEFAWESDIGSLSRIFTFVLGVRKVPGMPMDISKIGDKFLFTNDNGKKILQGISTIKRKTGAFRVTTQVKDIAFYLNKSEVIYQFNNIAGEDAIKKVLSNFGINASIPKLNVVIDEIFVAQTPNYIINYIVGQYNKVNEVPYRWRIDSNGDFQMFKRGSIIKTLSYQPASNLQFADFQKLISKDSEVIETLDQLFTSTKVAYLDDKSVREVKTFKDQQSIDNYGELQKVFPTSKDDIAKAKKEAEIFLKKALKLEKLVKLSTIITNTDVQAGDCVKIKVNELELDGLFEIERDSHVVRNNLHFATLTLREVL